MKVLFEEEGSKGRAYIKNSESNIAEMTFSKAGYQLLIIDHTEVDETMQGKGLGRMLLDRIVAHTRENQLKVLPLCPFAKSVFEKDASIRDVLR